MILDEDMRRFMRGQVSIIAAASDAKLNGSLMRALGCRVEQDDVTVFLAAEQSARLLDEPRRPSLRAHQNLRTAVRPISPRLSTPEGF